MKTVRKTLILAACAIMLVCATVAGTLAYLTSKVAVENTFTVGNVAITLDERNVNPDGTPVEPDNEEDRGTKNDYKLMPGQTYLKDPTIHVDGKSEDCYVFVKVDNALVDIEDKTNIDPAKKTIEQQMTDNGWSEVAEGIYGKAQPVHAGDDVVVFENFTVSGDVEADVLSGYENSKINVTAYAIQADGFESAQEAWNAAGEQAQGNA